MKKVLILVVSSQEPPYGKMLDTSQKTWDSVLVDRVETIYYCGKPLKHNTDKVIYFNIPESYATMGEKMLQAFDWCLKNKTFDYIARVNSSCYVDKKELIKHVQTLPDENVFSGIEVESKERWMWGGGQFILSKDVIEKIVENQQYFQHGVMEDVGISYLANLLAIPYTKGKACSINKQDKGWLCIAYGSESLEFEKFEDLKKLNQFFYRVKHDPDRSVDEIVMNELYNVLK